MKTRLTLLALAATVVLASGCATTSDSYTTKRSDLRADSVYIAKVEAIARRRGVDVEWVNPPRIADRRVARSD